MTGLYTAFKYAKHKCINFRTEMKVNYYSIEQSSSGIV